MIFGCQVLPAIDFGEKLNQTNGDQTLTDKGGCRWDFRHNLEVNDGTDDPFDGGLRLAI